MYIYILTNVKIYYDLLMSIKIGFLGFFVYKQCIWFDLHLTPGSQTSSVFIDFLYKQSTFAAKSCV